MATRNDARVNKVPPKAQNITSGNPEQVETQFPIRIMADPQISGPALTKALSLVGLELGSDEAGNWWIGKAAPGWVDRLPEPERRAAMASLMTRLDDVRDAAGLPPVEREPVKTLEERIEEQRGELFGAMAVVAVCFGSVDRETDYDLQRALEDAYKRFDRVAADLSDIAAVAREICGGAE